jgi:hypothetical protein
MVSLPVEVHGPRADAQPHEAPRATSRLGNSLNANPQSVPKMMMLATCRNEWSPRSQSGRAGQFSTSTADAHSRIPNPR